MEVVSASGYLNEAAWSSEWVGPAGSERVGPAGSENLIEAMWLERRYCMQCEAHVTFIESQQRPFYFFLPTSTRVQNDMQLHGTCGGFFVCWLFLMYRHWKKMGLSVNGC